MAIFNRNNSKEILNENSGNIQNFELGGIDAYNFVRGLKNITSDTYNNDYLLDRMTDDSIISSAIDMYVDDSLQLDPLKKDMFWVEVESSEDSNEKKLAEGLSKELNAFLKEDLNMSKNIRTITRRVVQYGSCVCRLDFIDKYADDKLELIKKDYKPFEESVENKRINRLVESVDEIFNKGLSNDLTNAFTKLKEEHSTEYDDIEAKDVIEALKESKKYISKETLKEDMLANRDTIRQISGRWYAELIGNGTNIWELSSKGRTLAYMDVTKPNFLLDPKNLVCFSNNTGKYQVNFEVGEKDTTSNHKEYFLLSRGESYLDNARVSWQILSALEDILMLTRMTRSALYRIFSVEVGNKGDKETANVLNQLKNRIKMDETINVREKVYNSELRQIPLGDSIFVPTRNGIGAIDIKTVGGDVNLKDAIDLDYFKDKLFAALRIPKAFLGFGDEGTGGMINTSLTKMDVRYLRTIKGIQNILSSGLEDLCKTYLTLTRDEKVLKELPRFKVVFASINTNEDQERNESKQTQLDTLDKAISAFSNMGIEVSNVPELRNALIQEYIGSDYLELIKKAGENGDLINSEPKEKRSSSFSSGLTQRTMPEFDNSEFGEEENESNEEETNANEEEINSEELGAGDNDFEASDNIESPEPLRTRELNTGV